MKIKWEYKVVHNNSANIFKEDFLNNLGQDGWECYAVNLDQTFYLKKPNLEWEDNDEHLLVEAVKQLDQSKEG